MKKTTTNSSIDWSYQVKLDLEHINFRQNMTACVYPNYEKRINLKLESVGLGFTLELDDAENLVSILNAAIEEFKK